MVDQFPKESALLNEIFSKVRFLTEDLQRDVLAYIDNIKEPRSYSRVNKPIEVDVVIGDKIIQANAGNLSASGIFIKFRINPDIGAPAKIVFSLPGQERPFKLDGTVVRTAPDGIGLRFSGMACYAQEHLDNILKGIQGDGRGDE